MGEPISPEPTDAAMDGAYVDRQRAALRDLLELSARCARRDEEIETRFATRRDEVAHRHKRLESYLARRLTRLRDQMESAQRAEQKQLDADVEQERALLARTQAEQTEQIRLRGAADVDELEQKLKHALWLADSVFEGAEARLKHQGIELGETLDQQEQALSALEAEADWCLHRYRQSYALEDVAVEDEPAPSGDLGQAYRQSFDQVGRELARLKALATPKWLGGWRMWVGILLPPVLAMNVAYWVVATGREEGTQASTVYAIALLLALAAVVTLGGVVWWMTRNQVRRAVAPLKQAWARAHRVLRAHRAGAPASAAAALAWARQQRVTEIKAAKEELIPRVNQRRERLKGELQAAAGADQADTDRMTQRHARMLEETRRRHHEQREKLKARYQNYFADSAERLSRWTDENQSRHDADRADLQCHWAEGLKRIADLVRESDLLSRRLDLPWSSACNGSAPAPADDLQLVRFGSLRVDVDQIAGKAPRSGRYRIDVPPTFSLPATLAFPQQGSLLIRTQRQGRPRAVAALHAVMLRLLTSLPPGRVRLALFDPIGLGQNFAGFMHLADYDESLVHARIWSEVEHIEQRLIDLTQHMENVIQKYLRNEFETILKYNRQAGELAEPYRFVVVADFPAGFSDEAAQRLLSIMHSGPRCGVYTLIVRNEWQELPHGIDEVDLRGNSVVLADRDGGLVWDDDVYGRFPLVVDDPPPENVQTEILKRVGSQAREAANVELPFDAITPAEADLWSGDTADSVTVPMGRCGATRLQHLTLGRGMAQHVLLAGKTGSGKSTLLHVLVTNLALWYGPDQLEFYLIDFKKGVEFKTYATHHLPHARAIAIESDREFGVSVLEEIDAEMNRRGELFRSARVQDLPAFRAAEPRTAMPRTLLLIDEFQELFTEDDRLAQRAALLLDRLVRQGRAFGIHVLLGTQTLGGTTGLPRGTMGQMAVRIALQCSEADSQLILNDDNTAAKLLGRPGEAIYNDAGGLIEGNSPFQVSWLPDAQRDRQLERVGQLAARRPGRVARPIVFEGNAPADITTNRLLAESLASWPPAQRPAAPRVWVGEPITIKAPTAASLRRQSGANLVLVGQQDESALAVLAGGLLGLAAQHAPGEARFVLLDVSPPDSPAQAQWDALAEALPHPLRRAAGRQVGEAVAELAAEVQRRLDADLTDEPPIFLVIHGLHRFRMLRKSEDDFGFSSSEPRESGPKPDKQFAEILREGPAFGVHTLAWCDTLASLDRTLDRQSVREFDYRLLFQMGATDSSNLVDSPDANRLGLYRALLYSEEQGFQEKFRPYAMPGPDWLKEFAARLGRGAES